jgi:uncharacterized membrane protein
MNQIPKPSPRLLHIDWARGLAVLWMIRGHVMDAFLAPDLRQSQAFGFWQMLGAYTAPAFLFLAGLSVGLSYAKIDQMEVAFGRRLWLSTRRGLEILGIAYLFRLEEFLQWVPYSKWRDLLRFDILNNIGISLILVGLLFAIIKNNRLRYWALALTTVVVALSSPAIWTSSAVNSLPWFFRNFFTSAVEFGHFPIFPYFVFVPAGAAIGLLTRRFRGDKLKLILLHYGLIAAGMLLMLGGIWAAVSIPHSPGWILFYNSPEYSFIRIGMQAVILAGCFFLCLLFKPESFSFMRLMGRHSLMIYWVHISLIYGRLTSGLQRNLDWPQVIAALILTVALMVLLAWTVENWARVRPRLPFPAPVRP